MTGPEFWNLPPDIRSMVHEVISCWDAHSFNRATPRGRVCKYFKEDKRGILSNPRFRFSYKRKFYMEPWFKHFDTYAPVGALDQFMKMKFQAREVLVGIDGKIIEQDSQSGLTDMDNSYFDKKITIAAKMEELKGGGIRELQSWEYAAMLEEMGLPNNKNTKLQFMGRGLVYDRFSQSYQIKQRDTVGVT